MSEEYRENFNYGNPNYYKQGNLSGSAKNTISDGIPGHGNGQLSTSTARLWGCIACCFGVQGCQRWYVGERGCCLLCCLTEGCVGIGQIVDMCCLISGRVEEVNSDIRRVAHQQYDANKVHDGGGQVDIIYQDNKH
ncbi:MAG: hypothetical protein EZS28_012811 [Streblomastix strix]|uniref:TM2 domain-containing protein n=1 Tax=Streblomastix strix TaxID=222440 RepID=A0A5J4W9R5_9EUKA|nr:MAG: hypothetical protein EZS28_012811 [Streblomastix strix]